MTKIKFLIIIFLSISCKNDIQTDIIINNKDLHQYKDTIIEKLETEEQQVKTPKIKNDFLLGKFDYKLHPEFIQVAPEFSSKTIYIQNDTYNAYKQMQLAAKKDGVELIIISGTRNFYEQKAIWNRKWKRYSNLKPIDRAKKILEYSSMPSTSRHHWGTDIDLNNLNNPYFSSGKGKKIYSWLETNANSYGFYQVYTDKSSGRTGYNLERWHWSYLPLASKYLDAYNVQISYENISDFEGAEFAEEVKIISDYVNGIFKRS